MGLDTLLVALGEQDASHIDAFAKAVTDVAGPAGATVVIAHVLTEETYRAALEEAGEETQSLLETRFKEGVPAHPGLEGDVPAWVTRRLPTAADRPEVIERFFDRKDLIQDLATALGETGINYEIRGAVGDPAERVVAMAADREADFVVVGGRKQSSARRALFGSVSQEILESVHCPVISIREGVHE
ncbi:universal stress protein [Halalkalicoccus jeotgali]|uniref:UspA domain protein n=1 Tax=Halalkalicoccus jeotgali (strain DSM 18796 / CECT 7217 / JCM 14584 / KCTC 4019 / B3) TaxID=795797 RepID=D8J6P2_HALJB|nr:universal stress protein [Halalkalicoccus jeotgali]ADJ13919.1 UspA domain protein [Halalkalicoccus jeotgali B3]ELY34036.1 UspA domain-containing protein [Halalkalicoccus jeotgali B3]